MNRLLSFVFVYLLMAFTALNAQAVDWQWAVQAGGSGSSCQCKSLCSDDEGNIYLAGLYVCAITLGDFTLSNSGGSDIFVAKLDPWGNWLWADGIGSYEYDKATDIVCDPDGNLVITGDFKNTVRFGNLPIITSSGSSDIFVAKISPSGAWLWSSRAGGSGYDTANSLDADYQGGIYVTGYFTGTGYFPGISSISSAGGNDIFLARLSSAGSWEWARRAGASNSDEGKSVVVDPSANVILCGKYRGSISFGDYQIVPDSNYPLFVAKADSLGNWLWANTSTGTGNAYYGGLSVDNLGNTYLTGTFAPSISFGAYTVDNISSEDIFVAKAGPTGEWNWAISAGGTGSDSVSDIEVDNEGNIWIAGAFEFPFQLGDITLNSQGNSDLYMAKLCPAGTWNWAIRTGGSNPEYLYDLFLDDEDSAFLGGGFSGVSTLGNTTLTSLGVTDAYALKYGTAAILVPPEDITILNENNEVLLFWNAVNGASAYKVESSVLPEGPYSDISAFGEFSGTSFSIDLPQGDKQFFRVTAIRN
jgi:hypothetical protein